MCCAGQEKNIQINVDSVDDIWPFKNAKVGRGMAQLDILVLQLHHSTLYMFITLLLRRYISFCELYEGSW